MRVVVRRLLYVRELRVVVLRRSEEHTSELQSHSDLVCRLLLEKKKKTVRNRTRRGRKNANRNSWRLCTWTGNSYTHTTSSLTTRPTASYLRACRKVLKA